MIQAVTMMMMTKMTKVYMHNYYGRIILIIVN